MNCIRSTGKDRQLGAGFKAGTCCKSVAGWWDIKACSLVASAFPCRFRPACLEESFWSRRTTSSWLWYPGHWKPDLIHLMQCGLISSHCWQCQVAIGIHLHYLVNSRADGLKDHFQQAHRWGTQAHLFMAFLAPGTSVARLTGIWHGRWTRESRYVCVCLIKHRVVDETIFFSCYAIFPLLLCKRTLPSQVQSETHAESLALAKAVRINIFLVFWHLPNKRCHCELRLAGDIKSTRLELRSTRKRGRLTLDSYAQEMIDAP